MCPSFLLTLIFTPRALQCNVSLVGQWIAEAKSKLEDPGVVYSYHGGNRKRDPQILAQNSIVVTTYETLASDAVFHAKKNADSDYCPPCEQVRFYRIICDESHVLRNANNAKSKAVMALVADNKWLVSGTPINTTVMDLKNQLLFLGIENASAMMEVFKASLFRHINDPSKTKGTLKLYLPGLGMFSFLARSIMMRHSQAQKYTGTNTTLMSLPPKVRMLLRLLWNVLAVQYCVWLSHCTVASEPASFEYRIIHLRRSESSR